MSLLIYAGLLYLVGISIILILKPNLMFAKDGSWKEFGLGRNNHKYTWMPFWLFTIFWAIISYVIILIIASTTGLAGVSNKIDIPLQNNSIEPQNISMKSMTPVLPKNKISSSNDMKSGYYILDVNETVKQGIPKYIYLGPETPNVIYNNNDSN